MCDGYLKRRRIRSLQSFVCVVVNVEGSPYRIVSYLRGVPLDGRSGHVRKMDAREKKTNRRIRSLQYVGAY